MSISSLIPFNKGLPSILAGGIDPDPLNLFASPPPPPAIPPGSDPAGRADVSGASQKAIAEERRRKGRRSTILTSGRGLDDDQLGIIQRPQAQRLLGA